MRYMRSAIINNQEEWLKVLGKGMVTLPKRWREELGIEPGDVVRAKKDKDSVVIKARKQSKPAPYRLYINSDIDRFLKADKLPKSLVNKLNTSAGVLLDLAKVGGHGPKDLSKRHDEYGWE